MGLKGLEVGSGQSVLDRKRVNEGTLQPIRSESVHLLTLFIRKERRKATSILYGQEPEYRKVVLFEMARGSSSIQVVS
jgi:hypothetical protein